MPVRILANVAGIVAVAVAWGQAQAPAEFEVASVKQNTLNDRIVTINVGPGGRFAARGYTLVLLMQRAYGVMDWNVTGGPAWIREDRWDVEAKTNAGGNLKESQLQPMLAKLLAERFKLKLHRSSKEMAGYALQVAKGGPKLIPSADGEEHRDTFRMGATGLNGQGITMENLARWVAGKLGLVAVDQTGLRGAYDVAAHWKLQPASNLPDDDSRDVFRAAVFAALQEQLGLKMAARKIVVPLLVIDSVEKASGN